MKLILTFLLMICYFPLSRAGDDVDETSKVVAYHPTSKKFIVVVEWEVIGGEEEKSFGNPLKFPMFFQVRDRKGKIESFIELAKLRGFDRSTVGSAEYRKAARIQLGELEKQKKKSGFVFDGIEPLVIKTEDSVYATIEINANAKIEEKGRVFPRKKNEMQRESIDLWLTSKEQSKPKKVKKDVLETVVRTHHFSRKLSAVYKMEAINLIVGLYNEPEQTMDQAKKDLWTLEYKF